MEMEDNDREENFRLKRFKALKMKKKKEVVHVCCCCLAMFEADEAITESVCPVCEKAEKAKRRLSTLKLNIVPCKSADNKSRENKKRLEHLMSYIDEVINLTRQYKIEGLISPSMEKFIKTCNQVKEKMEDYVNPVPLCDVCKKALEHTNSRAGLALHTGSSRTINLNCSPDNPTEGPPCSDSTYNLTDDSNDKLGYFEKKFKEIVKVTRLQNHDGSISEEKQVITIRTERRNPHRSKALDGGNDDNETFFDSFGGGATGGHVGNTFGQNFYRTTPRETKSEHARRSHQMGEPKLRSCMSAGQPKATMNRDAGTNFNSSACVTAKPSRVTLVPDSNELKNSCTAIPNISRDIANGSQICCPKKSTSCYDSLQSIVSTQEAIPICKQSSLSTSVQTCCKEIFVKNPMEDKGTCYLPNCLDDTKFPDDRNIKNKSISTEALWRDVWTSTTDLVHIPSRLPSKKPSPTPSKETICSSKDSLQSTKKKYKVKKSNSCCIVKIISKPGQICSFEEKEKPKKDPQEVVLRGSMLDAIKKIFLPSSRSNDSCKFEPPKVTEIKNICKSCISKLDDATSQKSSMSTSKQCETKTVEEQEEELLSCSRASSYSSTSLKSMGVGSTASHQNHVCSKFSTPSIHSQKHVCCLAKKDSDVSSNETCCKMAQTTSKSICCSSEKSSSASCPAQKSTASVKSASTCFERKDAGTCTKRSTRFDVRPLRKRHTCEKVNLNDCTCYSDSYMLGNRFQRGPIRSSKSCDGENYFFRW